MTCAAATTAALLIGLWIGIAGCVLVVWVAWRVSRDVSRRGLRL